MRTGIQAVTGVLLLGACIAIAQGPRGRQNGAGGVCRQGVMLDTSRVQTVEGAVTAVNIALGAQYPSISIGNVQIKVAPAWFLLERDFEIKSGDRVRVTAAPVLNAGDGYVYALEIQKTATGQNITLRDASGIPLWAPAGTAQNGRRVESSGRGTCIDVSSITTVSGIVDTVVYGAGISMPTLVLRLPDGTLMTIKIGPERILLENDFEIHAGETATVKLAYLPCANEYVALALTNSDGVTVALRNDDGTPAWD